MHLPYIRVLSLMGNTCSSMFAGLGVFAIMTLGFSGSKHPTADAWGRVHLILCGDYKQLPPATSRPPFIGVDEGVMRDFRFRVLRQNRRLAAAADGTKQQQLDEFHQVLEDVAHNLSSSLVRSYVKDAYVQGAMRNPHNVDFETSTACFTKRAYRDRWNRIILKRSSKKHKRSLKIKAIFTSAANKDRAIQGQAVSIGVAYCPCVSLPDP